MSDDQGPSPTPRHRNVLDASAALAREMGHPYIGVEHLFLAIIRDRAAVPTQVLARITDLDQLEASLREVMASPSYAGEAPAEAVWLPRSELPGLLAALPDCVPPGTRYGFNVAEDQAWIMLVDEPAGTAEAVASARAVIERRR
jgi:Clp amino terminal domain, pathogenicity island component